MEKVLRKSDRKFIRLEKTRIRRQFLDVKKQEEMIDDLYKKFLGQTKKENPKAEDVKTEKPQTEDKPKDKKQAPPKAKSEKQVEKPKPHAQKPKASK